MVAPALVALLVVRRLHRQRVQHDEYLVVGRKPMNEEDSNTQETGYKVAICPRGNLLYLRIYLITDQKLQNSYFISDVTL